MHSKDPIRQQRDLQAIFNEVSALLNRQQVVTGLVGRQDTPRRELVQNLLQRQQSAELQRKLQQLHPADIAFVLENLPPERRALLWSQVPEKERGAILLELADPVRESSLAAWVMRKSSAWQPLLTVPQWRHWCRCCRARWLWMC